MIAESEVAPARVELEPEHRRALWLMKGHGLMTVSQFASVVWLANPDLRAAEEMLRRLQDAGLVEPVLRSVGPLRFAVTPAGIDEARR